MHKISAAKTTNTHTTTACQSDYAAQFFPVPPRDGISTLSQDNPEAQTWADYKHQADVVSWAFRPHANEKVQRWSQRIANCGKFLTYGYTPHAEGYQRELVTARLCRVRTCPICQWRRSLKLTAEVGEKLHKICKEGSGLAPVMLTLTIRNCDVSELRETIQSMLRAWSKMTRRVIFKDVQHWARSVEVTRGRKRITTDSHPHVHILMVLPIEKVTTDFMTNDVWAREWQDLLGLDYLPVCDIRPINQTNKGGIREVLKYAVKPSEETAISGWLAEVSLQIDGLRMFAASKNLRIKDELEEEATDDNEARARKIVAELPWVQGAPHKKTVCIFCYRWDGKSRHYWRTQVLWGQTPQQYRDYAIACVRGRGSG